MFSFVVVRRPPSVDCVAAKINHHFNLPPSFSATLCPKAGRVCRLPDIIIHISSASKFVVCLVYNFYFVSLTNLDILRQHERVGLAARDATGDGPECDREQARQRDGEKVFAKAPNYQPYSK